MRRRPGAHPDDVDVADELVEARAGTGVVMTGEPGRTFAIDVIRRHHAGVHQAGVAELAERERVHGADVPASDESDADHAGSGPGSGAESAGSTSAAGPTAPAPKRRRTASFDCSTARCRLRASRRGSPRLSVSVSVSV